MRYEDASQSGSSNNENPIARDDTDALAAGSRGPAMGNVISGAGTLSGAAGADLGAEHAHIVSISGQHGSDSTFSGGKLVVDGQFGRLSVDGEGNYSYLANKGAPENSRDPFTYKLADDGGHSDTGVLTIEIGKSPTVVQANARQVVPGPDGVVVLPAGVELSDVHVVGRNLVIDLPDGTQMLIIDGAVFVPQLVLGDVEVPATSLAALLIGSELRPAAGSELAANQSGGGNFAVPLAPLDPGVPLGDLIPPTELGYVPPTFRETALVEDSEPSILIQTPDQPAGVENATASVDESALPARNGEPAGSNSASTAESTSGTIVYTSLDSPNTITIGGTAVTAVGQIIPGTYGSLTITSIANGAIGYIYTLGDNTLGDATGEVFTVVITDRDGDQDTATLTVSIIDDVPTARPDVDSVTEDGALVADGNLVTGSGGGDANATDGVADTQGADGAFVSLVDGTNPGIGQVVPDGDGEPIVGQYGTLTVYADGRYSYALDNTNATVQALSAGQTLTEGFNYTLTDNDGDTSPSTLTITINGTNDVPTVHVPQAGEAGTEVDEAGLPAGSAAATDAEITSGTITFTNGDGASTVTINGTLVVVGANIAGDYGTLHIDSVVGTSIGYTYTLTSNVDNDTDLTPYESFNVLVADSDGNPADDASATLRIDIVDDVPTARADVDSVTEDGALVADGNLVTGSGGSDANATDGVADTQGADGAFVSLVDGTNPGIGQVVPDGDGEPIVGQYGTLTVYADGRYSYALDNTNATVQALSAGQTLTEGFNYTLTDNDGDTSPSTLTITINGTNDVPTVHVPQAGEAGTEVDEAGLPAGSAAATDAEITSGTITFTNGDGASTVTINGTLVVVGANIAGDYGTLHIDSVVGTSIGYTYTLTSNVDNDTDLTPYESFNVLVADSDGNPADDASATLRIDIVDDVPTARADVDSVTEDGALVADGNLVTGSGGGDANATDGVADTQGADGAFVSLVDGTNPGIGQVVPDGDGEPIVGQYGTLTVYADGRYSYALDNTNATVQALSAGQTLTEGFNYTLTDNDGDTSPSTLTITINGTNDVPTVHVPQAGEAGTEVDEAGLPAGSAAATDAEITSGTITFTNGDGASTVTINGTLVVVGANIAGDYGTLHIDSVVGTSIGYTYTLTSNVDNDTDLTPYESFNVLVADSDGNPADDASATLRIDIIDDVPTARPDVDSVTEDGALVADGNLVTGSGGGDANATDGVADTQGADGAFVSLVDGTNPGIGQVVPDGDGEPIVGQYGTLTVYADGRYSYALDNTNATVQALSAGQTLTEGFNYTLTDNDGDTSPSTLTITINGTNDVPTVHVPQAGEAGTEVDEAGLPAGSAAATDAEITSGTITFTNGDGASTVTINGTLVVVGANIAGDYGTLHIDSVVGTSIGYTYTLTSNVDNDTDLTPYESFNVLVADSDGNPADDASATLRIDIIDDVPTARPDVDSVTEDGALVADGNLVSGSGGGDANATDGVADTQGADGAFVSLVDGTNPGIGQVVPDGDGEPIVGQYGTLTVYADGRYSYALDNTNATVQALSAGQTLTEGFNYTLTDNDGDTSPSTLTITINGTNDVPTVHVPQAGEAGTEVDEAGLPAGSAAATDAEITSGTITFTNGDGASTVTINGTLVVVGANIAGDYGTLHIDSVVGTSIGYTYTLTSNVDNDTDLTPYESFNVLVADSDGNPADDASATLRIDIVDDVPTAAISASGLSLIHDESPGVQADTDYNGVLSVAASNPGDDPDVAGTGPIGFARSSTSLSSAGSITGADGGTIVVSLTLSSQGVDSGLDTTDGTSIFLFKEGQTIVGRVGVDATAAATGSAAFAIALGAGNELEMVQYLSINHPTGGTSSPDELVSISSNVLFATTTVTDNDQDVSVANTSVGQLIGFQDSAPVLSGASDINIQNSGDVAANGTFAFNLGSDGPKPINDAVQSVNFTAVVNNVTVQATTPLTQVSEDANTAVFSFSFTYSTGGTNTATDTGTITFYKTDANLGTGHAAGTYTVDLANPVGGISVQSVQNGTPPVFYDIDQNGDGDNTDAADNNIVAVSQVGTGFFIQFTGQSDVTTPASNFGNNDLWGGGVQSEVKISSTAIGVFGNSVQDSDVLDYNFYSSNPGATVGAPTASATTTFVRVTQFNGAEDFVITLKLADPATPGTFIERTFVINANDVLTTAPAGYPALSNGEGYIIFEPNDYQTLANVPDNYEIVGMQLRSSTEGVQSTPGEVYNFNGAVGAAGGYDGTTAVFGPAGGGDQGTNDNDVFKILDIGVVRTSTTNQSATLTFDVTIQDGDGDLLSQTLQATITSAVDSSTPLTLDASKTTVTPVALDTNHDGSIAFLAVSAGVTYDHDGNGAGEGTAWVAPGDSLLVRDADGNGTVSGSSEFVFGSDSVTDLQALHAQYGEQLDASDADFVQFMLWNDANSNGIADAGELQSLTDAGIVAINLVSDGIASSAADGDVSIAGSGEFTYVNDNGETKTGLTADAAFRTVDREIEQAQRFGAAANSAVLVTAAVAAVGLAASQAAAQPHDPAPTGIELAVSDHDASQVGLAAQTIEQSDSRSLLGNEVRAAVDDHDSSASTHSEATAAPATVAAEVQHDAHEVTSLLAPTDAPDQDNASSSPVAPMVVLPSVEGLEAMAADHDVGAVQRAVTVEKVLAEALDGGAGGGDVDAILAALPSHEGHGNAALEALASQNGEIVSGWDMGDAGHLSAAVITNIVTDMAVFHHDAVQPAING